MRHSDCGCFENHQMCIWFRTTYESGLGLIWKKWHVLFRLTKTRYGSQMGKKVGFGPLFPAVWTKPLWLPKSKRNQIIWAKQSGHKSLIDLWLNSKISSSSKVGKYKNYCLSAQRCSQHEVGHQWQPLMWLNLKRQQMIFNSESNT